MLDYLLEETAAAALFDDCWSAEPPEDRRPPTEAEQRWFGTYCEREPMLRVRSVTEQETMRERALEIAHALPILTSTGRALPAPHRLYVALEMAKLELVRGPGSFATLRSVVIYPDSGRLLKNGNEAGIARMRGPRIALRLLGTIESLLGGIESLAAKAGARGGAERARDRQVGKLRKQLATWRTRLDSEHYDPGREAPQILELVERVRTELRPLLLAVARSLSPRLGEAAKAAEETIARAADSIDIAAARVLRDEDALTSANQCSVHVSWVAQIMGQQTDSNVLVHELAHALDFEHRGPDGCPSPSAVHVGAELAQFEHRWAAMYERAERGELAVLGDYAKTNALELFAVASERYFTRASELSARAPELFELLGQTYGYVPADRPRASWFGAFRTLFLSKLRAI